MKRLNRQGAIIISAGSLAGYNTIPKLAKAAGIPYTTLLRDLTVDFGSMTTDRLRAIVRITRMKPNQILEIVKD